MNSIRKGCLIRTQLFSVCPNELSGVLNTAGIGCHIGGGAMNHLAYADDLVLLAASTTGLNKLFKLCNIYADENYVKHSASKTVCMLVLPYKIRIGIYPKVYIGAEAVKCLTEFRYLRHVIISDLTYDKEIIREIRTLFCRGIPLSRKIIFCKFEVKAYIFES